MEGMVTCIGIIVETISLLGVESMMIIILIQVNYVVRVEEEKVKNISSQIKLAYLITSVPINLDSFYLLNISAIINLLNAIKF